MSKNERSANQSESWSSFSRDHIIAISSATIALSALLFSLFSFWAQRSDAKKQFEVERQLEIAKVRPILKVRSLNFDDHVSIKVINVGLGPAVITNADFWRDGGKKTNEIVKLFNLEKPVVWDCFTKLSETVLQVGEEIELISLTSENLKSQGIDEPEASGLLRQLKAQEHGIEVVIEYEDVMGNQQDPWNSNL